MTAAPTPAPSKAPKQKRKDAYIATVKIGIPLDMTNADSLAGAIKATEAIKATLPADATCTIDGRLGKI